MLCPENRERFTSQVNTRCWWSKFYHPELNVDFIFIAEPGLLVILKEIQFIDYRLESEHKCTRSTVVATTSWLLCGSPEQGHQGLIGKNLGVGIFVTKFRMMLLNIAAHLTHIIENGSP